MDEDNRALHEAARRGWPEPCRLLLEDARSIAIAQGEDSAAAVVALVNSTDEVCLCFRVSRRHRSRAPRRAARLCTQRW